VLKNSARSGFTLIELIITVAIFGILLSVGIPSFVTWTQNAQIRTAAHAIQNGLQLARGEAVRRNALIRFQLTSSIDNNCNLSTTDTNWVISFDNPSSACGGALLNENFPVTDATNNPAPRMIQLRPSGEGSARVVATATQSTVVFSGLGRADQALTVDLSPSSGGCTNFRCLRVTVTTGGQIRMCDPTLSAGDPQAC
jgi:type IV fimbrial biogenesis protein FimT